MSAKPTLMKGCLVAESATLACALLLTFWAWPQIPNTQLVAIHWGVSGQPDGFAPKPLALLVLPGLMLLTAGIVNLRISTEKFSGNLEKSRMLLWVTISGVYAMLVLAQWLIIWTALGHQVPVVPLICAGVGVLFAITGGFMAAGKTHRNSSVGVRTPWTLKSDKVWDRTNRITGWWMAVVGILAIVTAMTGNVLAMAAVAVFGPLPIIPFVLIYPRRYYEQVEGRK